MIIYILLPINFPLGTLDYRYTPTYAHKIFMRLYNAALFPVATHETKRMPINRR